MVLITGGWYNWEHTCLARRSRGFESPTVHQKLEKYMRYFKYCEPCGDKIISEEEIIKEYFPYWKGRMQRVGREELISKERCIEDFCTVHWAFEITNSDVAKR